MYPLSDYFITNLEPLIISNAIQIVENIYFIKYCKKFVSLIFNYFIYDCTSI